MRSSQMLAGEGHLPEHRPLIDHGQSNLGIICNSVDTHLPPLQYEESLVGITRCVEELARFEMAIRASAGELFQLFFGERLKDIHHGEEPYFFLKRYTHRRFNPLS